MKLNYFYHNLALIDAFDENRDGEIDKYEIDTVFRSIDPSITKQDVNLMV